MNHSSESIIVDLTRIPPDCVSKTLSFLSLFDVLSFGSIAFPSLRDAVRDVSRRRCLLCQPLVCSTPNPFRYLPASEAPCPALKSSSPESDEMVLPSVYQRIVCLHRSLPTNHRLRAQVRFLVEELKPIDDETHGDRSRALPCGERFSECLLELRRQSRAHRLHASITKSVMRGYHHESRYDCWRATPRADSCARSPSTANASLIATRGIETMRGNQRHPDPETTVALDDYIGDVLCAYFLMGHSAAMIVEGGPSERCWMDLILDEVSASTVCTKSWYLAWVFMHSTLLRTAPFTHQQRSVLGLDLPEATTLRAPGGEQAAEENAVPPLLPPALPFMGVEKRSLMYCMRMFRVDLETEAVLKITFNDFGRLGAFRGRDDIRTVLVAPVSINRTLTTISGQLPSAYQSPELVQFIRQWRGGSDAGIRWMLEAHAEAFKTRPMTVAKPTISILKTT